MQEGPDPCPEGLEEVARVVEGLPDDHGHDLGGERGPADQDDLQPAAGGGEGVQAALQGAHHVPASTDPVLRDAGQQCQGGDPHQLIILILILILGMPHICGMDTYGMKIMPQMSGIATFQDIYGMLIFEDEHAIDV